MDERASKGGRARATKLTPEQRSESARHAVRARWGKHKSQQRAIKLTAETVCTTPCFSVSYLILPRPPCTIRSVVD
jgi:hypothetical protein